MRTGMLRLAAGTGATAMLVGIGALATAGSASAATAPVAKTTTVSAPTTHFYPWGPCYWAPVPAGHPPVLICEDEPGIYIGGLISIVL